MQAALCGSHNVDLSGNTFLRTGHSHEDVDAMFGTWAQFLGRQKTLETPSDFRQALAQEFRSDTHFTVLDYVRDWSDYFGECLLD
eukprot:12271866-Alexandrium_andersonii.AAC.1